MGAGRAYVCGPARPGRQGSLYPLICTDHDGRPSREHRARPKGGGDRRPLRARHPAHRKGRDENARGGRGRAVQDARKALPVRDEHVRVEGARHRRRPPARAQGDQEGPPRHAARQDAQGLRQPRDLVRHEPAAQHRLRQELGLEGRRRFRRGRAHLRNPCHPLRQLREREPVQGEVRRGEGRQRRTQGRRRQARRGCRTRRNRGEPGGREEGRGGEEGRVNTPAHCASFSLRLASNSALLHDRPRVRPASLNTFILLRL